MDLGLSGRVVLVTGGSDGLGAATAAALLDEGARVAICGRDEDRLARTAAALEDRAPGPDAVLAVRADVTDPAACERLVAAPLDRWGRLDALVNNAGASSAGAFADLGDERWSADLELKVLAAARLARLARPALERSDAGAILNVLSITAKAPGPGSMPTSVSRAAGLALTKALAQEWGPRGIRVNAILIGMVRSSQWDRIASARGVALDDLLAERAERIPLRRVADAAELGALATLLLSPRCGYVSGAAVTFDGGVSAAV